MVRPINNIFGQSAPWLGRTMGNFSYTLDGPWPVGFCDVPGKFYDFDPKLLESIASKFEAQMVQILDPQQPPVTENPMAIRVCPVCGRKALRALECNPCDPRSVGAKFACAHCDAKILARDALLPYVDSPKPPEPTSPFDAKVLAALVEAKKSNMLPTVAGLTSMLGRQVDEALHRLEKAGLAKAVYSVSDDPRWSVR